MIATIASGWASGYLLDRSHCPQRGTFASRGVSGLPAPDHAVLTSVRSTARGLAFAAGPRNPHKQDPNQNMARMAASGGVSGPYPAWDPV